MRIGYIGLGNMGGAIASALAAKHDVHVFDISTRAVAACARAGAKPCATVAEVADRAEAVFLCVPGFKEVSFLLGEEGELRASLRPGSLIVDQSTTDPVEFRKLADNLARAGVTLVDAPVSGGPRGVEQRTIVVMVGGPRDVFEKVAGVLNDITENVIHVGPTGTAMMTKVANNYLAALQAAASLEVVALAQKFGCDPLKTADIIALSSGDNSYVRRFLRQHVLSGRLEMSATISVMQKDVELARKAARLLDAPIVGDGELSSLIADCVDTHGANASYNALALTVERQAGVALVGSAGESGAA